MTLRLKMMTQNNESSQTLGERLKDEREYRGFSTQEIADYLALSQTAVEEIESGQREIGSDSLERLADLYELSVDKLCDDQTSDEADEAFEVLERSNEDLSESDRDEIQRFLKYLNSRQSGGGSHD
ncbi:helix-turn-helix domain-containing protein [Haloarcula marina]|uniref:helix-turn-helix domain-containing protein n=1 Tax=Haloarcula marina TaxID=2961574 RepID=UPI0020B8C975|nr:helix-turn-helix transcriptional regulator [Halomicroarcula marina]